MGAQKYKYLPKITKNGLKWPKFNIFIVIKWFYEKMLDIFYVTLSCIYRAKITKIQAFSTLKAVFSKNAQKNRSQAQLIHIISNLVCKHPIGTSKT